MAERKQIATWLIDHDLIPDGLHSADGPPLSSPFAPAVAALNVHTEDGLLALRHEDATSLVKRPELASLGPEQRELLVARILSSVKLATAHDEL